MTLGYSDPERLRRLQDELTTWELYQVQIDKYHVMFWFEGGNCLLNAAYRFSFRSADGETEYTYDVQASGNRKQLNVDSILRRRVVAVAATDERRLALTFEGGDTLFIHDAPQMRSAWFMRYEPGKQNAPLIWSEDDEEGEDDF